LDISTTLAPVKKLCLRYVAMNNTFSPYKSLINVDLPTLLSPKIIRLAERASELTFTVSMFNKSSTVIFFINNYLLFVYVLLLYKYIIFITYCQLIKWF